MTEVPEVPDPLGGATVMSSAVLKALAHPLRRRITKVLAQRRFARAADLAADLGTPANRVSFHLRVLAEAGLIEEAPEHARDRRDRVWKAAKTGAFEVGTPEHPIEDEVAGSALMGLLAEEHQELVRRVMSWAPEYVAGRQNEVHATFQQRTSRLTAAEFERAMRRVNEILDEAAEAHDPDDPDGRFWQIDVVAADDLI